MATYLIDFENVHHHGLTGIEKLTEEDYVVIFVGANDKTIPMEAAMSLSYPKNKAYTIWKEAEQIGRDYLDIQLASYLGSLIGDGKGTEFIIVSKDHGFIAAKNFWEKRKSNIIILLQETISDVKTQPKPAQKQAPSATNSESKLPDATKKEIRKIVKSEKLSPGHYTGIYNLFKNKAIKSKQDFHTGLVKLFEQERGSKLYKLLKAEFEAYRSK
jgi:hypothetical protein